MDRWQHLEELFLGALELAEPARSAYLDARAKDSALRSEVEAMLAANAESAPLAVELELVTGQELANGEPAGDPREGERIGAYRLIERIGSGGMGDVYRAERADGEFAQTVAVKLLRRRAYAGEGQRRFRAERQILARLDHPNITKLYDGGTTDDGQVYLVMEAVEGESVTEYCDRLRLDVDGRLRLFLTICEAVQYAHMSLVVHRDLKPANVLVTEDGRVKLLDFGIAKLLDEAGEPDEGSTTQTGLLMLTPDYASPEQIQSGVVTAATDVHGLGLLLYELLTGVHPFRREAGPLAAARAVVEEEAPRPSRTVLAGASSPGEAPSEVAARARLRGLSPAELGVRLTGDLDIIIAKALHKEAERRYSSADQLAGDVFRHLAHFPIQARRETWTYRARKFVRRNRGPVAAGVTGFALLASFAFSTAVQSRTVATERDIARDERNRAEQATELLLGLFESANPARTLGDTVPVGAFLEQGLVRSRAQLADQPLVRSEVLSVIAGAFHSLGNPERAAAVYDSALAAIRSAEGDTRRDEATLTFQAGELARQADNLDVSEELFRRHLEIVRDLEGDTGIAVLDGLRKLREVIHHQGRAGEADSIGAIWLERARALESSSDPRIIQTLMHLAARASVLRESAEAERLSGRALELETLRSGARHPRTAVTASDHAGLLTAGSKFAEAETIGEEALDQLRAFYPNGHQTEVTALMHVAQAELGQRKHDEAEAHVREAIALLIRSAGSGITDLSLADALLARALVGQGRYEEAEVEYLVAAKRFEDEFGYDYPVTMEYRGLLILSVYLPQERFEEAELVLLRDYRTLTATRGPDNPYVRNATLRLHRLYEAWGRPDEAADYAPPKPPESG